MHSSLTDRIPSVNANMELASVLALMKSELKLTFQPHPLCAAPTMNLGVKIEGGVGYGVCPGVAEFQSDIRTLPGMSREKLHADIERCLESIRAQRPGLRIEFQFEQPPLDWIPPTEVSGDHPLVSCLMAASEQVLGWQPRLTAFPGGTDAAKFQGIAGIPTIPSFGPGWLDLAHCPNECVSLSGMTQAAKMYALAARQYLDFVA
jgi:acetylornithine deacetylase